MVVKMIKWRPRPPQKQSKKFEAKIMVRSITGLQHDDDDENIRSFDGLGKLMVEISWKGSKTNGFRSLKKKSVKKACTSSRELTQNGVVVFDKEFKSVCRFRGSKDKPDGVFLPWEVAFSVFNKAKTKDPLTTPAVLNLAEFASLEDAKELDINIPLSISSFGFKCCPSLCISLCLTELSTAHEHSVDVQRPVAFSPLSPCFGGAAQSIKKDEGSTFKNSLRKVKSLTHCVSSKKSKKVNHGGGSSDSKFSTGSDSDYNYPFDTDSFDGSDEHESEDSREDFGYGSLVHVNLVGGAHDLKVNCEDEELVYYSNKQVDLDSSPAQELSLIVPGRSLSRSPRFDILPWKKRKLSFKSLKVKGEPLLRKEYAEEGGDDIDYDRRQLSSDESMVLENSVGSGSYVSEFGDDNFAVGSWEEKELLSRDGSMKLRTQVFFASIDQRSERAAGESACTALVAVIADWLHSNQGEIPIKSEFDSLIREGSLQWRNLCEDEGYRERFPDKHFDLETVLEAKIRPLTVVPDRSFIGFFHPEGFEEEHFHFLKGALSFDDIWGEIRQAASELNRNSEPLVYIVSWNDHFFILKIDWDAYYIIDTLGERLFECCTQAFVLKFDEETTIEKAPCQASTKDEKDTDRKSSIVEVSSPKEKLANNQLVGEKSGPSSRNDGSEVINLEGSGDRKEEEMVISRGKESCKEYIKRFLAAIPIRELQVDMKKGLMSSTPLHHRLQIELNYTARVLEASDECIVVSETAAAAIPPVIEANVHASMAFEVPAFGELLAAETAAMASNVQASVPVDVPALTTAAEVQSPIAADVPASMLAVAVA